jgi:peptidyl-prolyl cis-trans isomerase B (cyclophilin B)
MMPSSSIGAINKPRKLTTCTQLKASQVPRLHKCKRSTIHCSTESSNTTGSSTPRRQFLSTSLLAAASLTQLTTVLPVAANSDQPDGDRLFFDIRVNGKPLSGRIVIQLFSDTGVAAQRFKDLTQGKDGASFRHSRFELIEDGYIQNNGLKALSYKASGRTSIAGGDDTEALELMMTNDDNNTTRRRMHDSPGLVSFLVKPKEQLVTKDKLVASKGQLITVTETFGEQPNGSAWTITTKSDPSLDNTNIVVGRVVEGQELVDALAALPRVKSNKDSPFFKAGQAAGDKRADVAKRAFGKPFDKIIIEECGVL